MASDILSSCADRICTITLNRPDKRNALTTAMIGAFRSAVERAAADPEVRVIVVAAAGPAFCAGLDLSELTAQRAAGQAETQDLEHVLETLERCRQPTIAAVQGDAIAGGCELALHCDLRVASDRARFAMPLARIGLAVPVTLTWKLVDTIGAAATRELLFTGRAVAASEARALGLVNRVEPAAGLDAAVSQLAGEIARNAPLALRAMKASIARVEDMRRTLERADLEELTRQVRASADLKEGLAAQRERRPPVFTGR
jgi:enoyl-CoA hydratase/carnithine racemase